MPNHILTMIRHEKSKWLYLPMEMTNGNAPFIVRILIGICNLYSNEAIGQYIYTCTGVGNMQETPYTMG